MKRSTIKIALALGLLPACCFDEAGESLLSTESSSSEGGSQSSTSVATTATTTTSATTATTTSSEASSDGTSSEGTETFGESATTTYGESSTGEPAQDWALKFDGTNHGITSSDVPWNVTDYTVETWIEITWDAAHGTLIDKQDSAGSGWLMAIEPGTERLLFTVWTGPTQPVSALGPTVDAAGNGWHHVAASKSGDTIYFFVDGVSVDTIVAAGQTSSDLPIALAYSPTAPAWGLDGVTIDDIRISSVARYTSGFEPPVDFDADADTMLLWHLDEGSGSVASDDTGDVVFVLASAEWVSGY
jgi:hypothetical protein